MPRVLAITAIVFLPIVFSSPATAESLIVSSTFDSDVEGWMMQSLSRDDFSILEDCPEVSSCIYGAVHEASGGNPGGYLSMRDSTSHVEYWRAPEPFLTGAASAYGGELRFDVRPDVGPLGGIVEYDVDHDVILSDTSVANLRLIYDLPYPTEDVWTTESVTLLESAGWFVESTGLAPTQAEMTTVLANLDHLWILGEFFRPGMDLTGMDNVMLFTDDGTAIEPGTWGLLKSMYR